jgi:hypothetical protein
MTGAVPAWLRRLTAAALAAAGLALCLMGNTGCQAGNGYVPASYNPGYRAERHYARAVFGIHGAEMRCLVALWDQESGWNPDAVNPKSGAYGIPQALPGAYGHPFALGDWQAQIDWGHSYIVSRYGDPCTAWDHEQADGWY